MQTDSQTLHAPQRFPHESQEQYRQRQAASKAVVFTMTHGPRQAPAVSPLDVSRFFLGRHMNPARNDSRGIVQHYGRRQAKKLRRQHITREVLFEVPRDNGQHPKFEAPRKHKQHVHALRDSVGVITLVGRDPLRRLNADGTEMRRTWLAGISAQRGF